MVLKRIASLLLVLLMLIPQALAEETEKVTYRDITVDKNTEYVDLGDRKVLQWDKLYDFLLQLPNLKKVDMYNVIVNLQVYNKLSYSLEGEPVRPAEAEAGNQDTREIGVGFVSMKLKR